jgi:hypothetical protein
MIHSRLNVLDLLEQSQGCDVSLIGCVTESKLRGTVINNNNGSPQVAMVGFDLMC